MNEKDVEEESYTKLSQEEIKLRDNLKIFYDKYFDINILWQFIKKKEFSTREFGFDLLDRGFTRNKSFEDPKFLKEYLTTFPIAGSYIGALYEDRVMPSMRYNPATTIHQTKWLGRELIFDLDMDEYDQVRTCNCKGREVCEDCWTLMQDAADIMDETLRVDFGFKELEWVYTGGRGYHCWILDRSGFELTQDQRAAIIGYMQLIHDPKGNQRVDSIGEHAEDLTRRIYQKIGRKFIMISTQTLLIKEAGFTQVAAKNAKELLQGSELISDIISSIPKGKEKRFLKTIIKYRYPRIDHKVTIDTRRLIRMPGSVHIKTKNISEILQDATTFNPLFDAKNLNDIVP